MKVLVVSGSFPPMKCGVGDYSQNLAKALAALPGLRIAVLTSIFAKEEPNTGEIEVFPIMHHWGVTETMKAIKIIFQWSPDIVHIQYPTQGYANGALPWILPLIAFLMGKKVMQTWHEGYARRDLPKLLLKLIVPGVVVVVRPKFCDRLNPVLRWILSGKRLVFIRNASSIPRIILSEQERCDMRKKYLQNQKRLIVFFGFVYPNKRVELLFQIANSFSDHIMIAGEVSDGDDYHHEIMRIASVEQWLGKVTMTGFLAADEVATLLSVADAVVLPFLGGGGEWNTSIHAAVLQGTFVITTSLSRNGYDEKHNVYYAKVDDIQEMKSALEVYGGRRREYNPDVDSDEWRGIAFEHLTLYRTLSN